MESSSSPKQDASSTIRPVAVEVLEAPRQVLVYVFLAVGVWYLGWRYGTLNPDAPVFSWTIYIAEIAAFSMALLHVFMCWRLTVRKMLPAPEGLTVDVFVPTYNESVAVVRKTLIAALAMDYPHRTWLLDDGNRPEMRALCDELGCAYLFRTDNAHAKAGNLNEALARTDGQFIAVFDADHAPHKAFLADTLGYFNDEGVAFVQTPQDFYNLDSYQHRWRVNGRTVWTEQSLFFRVIQRGKDAHEAAFYCGSCAIIRRAALERIGGFATGTVTEDLHTSIRLHAAGYRSVYHARPLAFGIAPESISPFITQRIRWGQGAMHVWRKEGILLNRGLSFRQRLNYFASVATYFDGWLKMIFYIAPVIVLTTGTLPILTPTRSFLLHFVPYYLLSFWVFEEIGRGFGRTLYIEQYNMTRFAAFAWSTLALIFPRLRFKVTPKGRTLKPSTGFALPQWLVAAANVGAIPVGVVLFALYSALPFDALVANILWASVNAGLAVAVLRFTFRSERNRRDGYRFPVPVAGRFAFEGGHQIIGTVDNISEHGFGLYGVIPAGLTPGTPFTGDLSLPDGPLMVKGEVRALIPHGESPGEFRGVGCRTQLSHKQQARLEAFLFGADLQWRVNGLTDQVATPLSTLFGSVGGGHPERSLAQAHWNAILITAPDGDTTVIELGLISTDLKLGVSFVLAYRPLLADRDWVIRVFARTTAMPMIIRASVVERLSVPSGDVYLHRIDSIRVLTETAKPAPAASSVADIRPSEAIPVAVAS